MRFTDYLTHSVLESASDASPTQSGLQVDAAEPIVVEAGWMQGRSCFGGLTAAIALAVMEKQADGRVLRSFNCNFVGPIDGTPLTLHPQLLRAGSSVTLMRSQLRQREKICVDASASFGDARGSVIAIKPQQQGDLGRLEDGQALPEIEGMTPAFASRFNYRFAGGKLPFTGKGDGVMNGYVRFAEGELEPAAMLTPALLLGLIDAWPPAVLPLLKKVAPASTLAWNVQFLPQREALSASQWFGYEARVEQAADGYGFSTATITSESGQVLALSQQTVTVFG